MASINQPDDEKENQPGGPVTTGGSGGAGPTSGAGSAPTSAVSQNQATQQNAGFTDVGTYLDANKAGSQSLGNQVAGNLTSKFNDVKGGAQQSADTTKQAISNGYVPENTDLIKQVADNPTGAAADPNQVAAYQAQLNDKYTGPTNWADYGTQQGAVNDATQYASLVNTPGGLNVYSQQAEGQTGGDQSQGINQLDTLLLGGSPQAMSTVKAAADPYATLNDFINSQNTSVGNAVTTGQNQSQAAAKDSLDAFTGSNGTLTTLNNNITNTASSQAAQAQAKQDALLKDISGLYTTPVDTTDTKIGTYNGGTTPWYNMTNYGVGDLNPTDLAQLGLTPDQWTSLKAQMGLAGKSDTMVGHNFGAGSPTSQIDLGQYLDSINNVPNITNATVATPEQYAQMSAIQKLLGGAMPGNNAIDPTQSALAGTAPTNGFTNTFDYNGALKDATDTEKQARAVAQQEANAISDNADQVHNAEKQHTFGGNFRRDIQDVATGFANPLLLVNKEFKEAGKQVKKVSH